MKDLTNINLFDPNERVTSSFDFILKEQMMKLQAEGMNIAFKLLSGDCNYYEITELKEIDSDRSITGNILVPVRQRYLIKADLNFEACTMQTLGVDKNGKPI